MQIYGKVNENKSIQAYSNEPQDGYTTLTIDATDSHFLAEYYGLMWVDDTNLVHADNLPVTSYQRQLAQQEEAIKSESDQVTQELATMQNSITQANQLNTELTNKVNNVNSVIAQLTQTMAVMQGVPTSGTTTSATDSATSENASSASSSANK